MFLDLSPLAASIGVIEKHNERKGRHPLAFTPPSFSLRLDLSKPSEPVDAIPVSYAFPSALVQMMAQPIVDASKAVKFAEPIVQGSPVEISSSMDEVLCKMEQDVLPRNKKETQAPSSFGAVDATTSDDVHSSVTPGSVRPARVVQPPPEVDFEPPIKATKQQQELYDIMRHFGNVRSNNMHMNAIRETKVINCYSTFVHMDDLTKSLMHTGKLSQNVFAAGIDYINGHIDIHPDKIIMSTTIMRRIWDSDFSHPQVCKVFAQHGDYKLTLKKFVMFEMFQELAPNDSHDKV
uniref:Uncharacterized protein n=1 Tax=Aegilops tauschii subsp. strangulata TaxID=200361 RepID=A0A453BKY2_AEGTS